MTEDHTRTPLTQAMSELSLYGVTYVGEGEFQDAHGNFKTSYRGPRRGNVYKEYISGKYKGKTELFMSQLEYEELRVVRNIKKEQLRQQRIAIEPYRPQRES